jgi:hypothetical protein
LALAAVYSGRLEVIAAGRNPERNGNEFNDVMDLLIEKGLTN